MKKILNFNFMTVAILTAMLVLTTVFAWMNLSDISTEVNNNISEMYDPNDDGEIDDVEGWGFIFGGSVLGLASLSVGFVKIASVLVTGALVFFMLAPALIARLIYRSEKGRILAYRILMFFSYACMGILASSLGNWIFAGKMTVNTVVLAVLLLYTIAVMILGIRNTYTKRIRNGQVEQGL